MTEYTTVETDFTIASGVLSGFTTDFITNYLVPGTYTIILKVPITITSISNNAFDMSTGTTLDPYKNLFLKILLTNCSFLTTIGTSAFTFCGDNSLTLIDLTGCSRLTTINNQAFFKCGNTEQQTTTISSAIILSGCSNLTTIGTDAFRGCFSFAYNVQPIDFSTLTSLTTIGASAFYFYGDSNTTSINNYINLFNTKLTSVGVDAFRAFLKDSVKMISLPITLPTNGALGTKCFCTKSQSISAPITTDFQVVNSVNINYGSTTEIFCGRTLKYNRQYVDYDTIESDFQFEVTTPTNTNLIGFSSTFKNKLQDYYVNLIIPASTLKINANAFDNRISIQSSDLSKQIKSINFSLCTLLNEIGEAAFYQCGAIQEQFQQLNIYKANKIQIIGNYAFYQVGKISLYNSKINLYNLQELTDIGNSAFYEVGHESVINEITLKECIKLKTIQNNAFYQCGCNSTTFQKIDFSGCTSLETIGEKAFYKCGSNSANMQLLQFNYLESLKDIQQYAFYECLKISIHSQLNLNCTNLLTIGNSAFQNCNTIQDIIFSESITTLGADAFSVEQLVITNVLISNNLYTQFKDIAFNLRDLIPEKIKSCYKTISTDFICETLVDGTKKITGIADNLLNIYQNYDFIDLIINDTAITEIGDNIFTQISNIDLVDLLNTSIVTIGAQSFYNLNYCYQFRLPSTIISVGIDAFSCSEDKSSRITYVYYQGNMDFSLYFINRYLDVRWIQKFTGTTIILKNEASLQSFLQQYIQCRNCTIVVLEEEIITHPVQVYNNGKAFINCIIVYAYKRNAVYVQ